MIENDGERAAIQPALTIVTVTYRAEDALQWLQARSLARFAAPDLVERVIVIDNGDPLMSRGARKRLIAAYGALSERVEVVPAGEVSQLPPASGWMGQQVLKLGISRLVETPWYVLLDAKNHLIRRVDVGDLLVHDGRARGGFHSYADHPLLPRLHHTLDYLDIERGAAEHFPPTSTPFMMKTPDARAVIDSLEEKSSTSFAQEFVRADLSEFFLYSAFLLKRDGGWDALYDGVAIQSPTVWGGRASLSGVEEAIALVDDKDAPFFAVHRRALRRLDRAARERLADYWVARGVLDSRAEVRRFLWRFRRDYARAVIRARISGILRRRR